jgi:hypothetical protein
LPSLRSGATWLNSPRLTLAASRGKVVLFEFWTYTCSGRISSSPNAPITDRGLEIEFLDSRRRMHSRSADRTNLRGRRARRKPIA